MDLETRILIVDDDEGIRTLISNFWQSTVLPPPPPPIPSRCAR
jgi:hypothetical protein